MEISARTFLYFNVHLYVMSKDHSGNKCLHFLIFYVHLYVMSKDHSGNKCLHFLIF